MSRFQMQSWSKDENDDRGWTPMENGAAAKVWRPRDTAEEAATKCLRWTGLVEIPAMQVVDLETGDVVWRGNSSGYYAEAGEPIRLPGERRMRKTIRDDFRAEAEAEREKWAPIREKWARDDEAARQLEMFAEPDAFVVECFWGARVDDPCPHVVRATTPEEAHDLMEAHYRDAHAADLEQVK